MVRRRRSLACSLSRRIGNPVPPLIDGQHRKMDRGPVGYLHSSSPIIHVCQPCLSSSSPRDHFPRVQQGDQLFRCQKGKRGRNTETRRSSPPPRAYHSPASLNTLGGEVEKYLHYPGNWSSHFRGASLVRTKASTKTTHSVVETGETSRACQITRRWVEFGSYLERGGHHDASPLDEAG